MPPARSQLARARRVVLKIGSKTLSQDREAMRRIAAEIQALRGPGREIVLVSSGAIALGVAKLGMRGRPREIARLQAAAAAGQTVLMNRWEEAFAPLGVTVAQVLLTHADLADRARGNNARLALSALLAEGALPIINENDTVAVEEIKFGDNDQLASMVVPLVDAELLVLLSDVEGLLDGATRVPLVVDVEQEARPLAGASTSGVGTGGMASKVEAARRATLAGAAVVVADGRVHGVLEAILAGEDVGTLFAPSARRIGARRHWIAFTLRPRGALVLDPGAVDALSKRGRSLLAVGVLGVRGDFRKGDAVTIVDVTGREVARGLARLSASDATAMAGRATDGEEDAVVVHRDDLVLW
ncbi:MAG: glutamate 5-kinase [Polyangiaceae bacterium]|nr:glutamate 5-kinase [Polyangiaceae bacterium]